MDDRSLPPRERFLHGCAKGRPWLYRAYWMFGGDVRPQDPDRAKEPTIAMLAQMLGDGEIVAGEPKGYFDFVPWAEGPAEAVGRIRREWDALTRPPNHGDVAAFTLTEEARARYRREHPVSSAERARILSAAGRIMATAHGEVEDLPEVAEEWEELGEYTREAYTYGWYIHTIDNELIPLEGWYRDGLLTAAQEARYEKLKVALAEAAPLLARFDVELPEEILPG